MDIFLFKSILSMIVILVIFIALFTMFEIFGRSEKRFNIEKFKKLHKANGIFYLLLFIFIAYFCIDFMIRTKVEPSPRGLFHSVFALTVFILLCLKISIVRFYRQFYGKVQTIGLLIALISFGMVGTSGGYFLLVTRLGTDIPAAKVGERKKEAPQEGIKVVVKTDPESIAKGKTLYESKCIFCHDPNSTRKKFGPGHQGILKNPLLPASGKPATPENILNQLRNPYQNMPSFAELPVSEVLNIIAFLNTL
jgi:mono/diheme cytochrome c family protein